MDKKGNTYYFTLSEKRTIKNLIDRKYGKETTPSDYDSTGGDYDMGVEGNIKECTGKHISGSTVERLVGLREKENKGVTIPTLEIIAEYLNYENYERFLKFLEHYSGLRAKSTIQYDIVDIIRQYTIKVSFPDNKLLILKYLNENKFEVIASINSKLQTGDKLEIVQLHTGEELTCDKVIRLRGDKICNLGHYKSGEKNPVTSIDLSKTKS